MMLSYLHFYQWNRRMNILFLLIFQFRKIGQDGHLAAVLNISQTFHRIASMQAITGRASIDVIWIHTRPPIFCKCFAKQKRKQKPFYTKSLNSQPLQYSTARQRNINQRNIRNPRKEKKKTLRTYIKSMWTRSKL